MKKYWYAAIAADDEKTMIGFAKTLRELRRDLNLGDHVINYYYRNNLVNKKLNVRIIRIPAPDCEAVVRNLFQCSRRADIPEDTTVFSDGDADLEAS